MQGTIGALDGRATAARRPWLLGILVLGIVGMHGLVLGSAAGVHHAAPSPPSVLSVPHPTHAQAAPGPEEASHVRATRPEPLEGDEGASGLGLCMALLLALAAAVAGARRTGWLRVPHRAGSRLVLPASPTLRKRTPVPRFTVMRC